MAIHTTWTADSKQAEREVQRMARSTQKLEDQYRKLTGKTMTSAQAAQRAGKISVKGSQEAVAAIKREEAEQIRLRQGIAQVVAAKQKRIAGERRLAAAARQAAAAQRHQTRGGLAGTRSWTGSLTSLAGGYLSVYSAITLVTTALREQEQFRQRAKQAHLTEAEWQQQAILMLPVKTKEEGRKYQETVAKIAAEVKPAGGKAAVHQVMVSALSASETVEQAARATAAGMKFSRMDPERAAALARSALDLRQILGEQTSEIARIGWAIQAVGQSRVEDVTKFARYGTKGISAAMGYGLSAQEATALFNALTKAEVDPYGRIAKTGTQEVAKDISEFYPEKDVYDYKTDPKTGIRTKKLRARGTGLKTFTERWERLLNASEEERAEFVGRYVEDASSNLAGAYRAFAGIHPKEETNKLFREFFAKTMERLPRGAAEAEAIGRETLEILEQPYAQKVARAGEATASTVERQQTETEFGRRKAREATFAYRSDEAEGKDLSNLLAGSGLEGVKGQMYRWRAWSAYWTTKKSREQIYEDILESRIADLRGEKWRPGLLPFSSYVEREPSGEEVKQADILQEQLRAVRERYDWPGERGGESGAAERQIEATRNVEAAINRQTDAILGNDQNKEPPPTRSYSVPTTVDFPPPLSTN